jgi:hypothetical protein
MRNQALEGFSSENAGLFADFDVKNVTFQRQAQG